MVIKKLPPPLTEEERMHRYGYREVPKKRPDGSIEYQRVALTLDDLLHPQMGDFAVLSSVHDLETTYLAWVFRSRLAHDPHSLVLHDCGVFWDVPPLRHHSPDISVIFNVREQKVNWSSFDVQEEKTRPTIIIEVVSPDYRENDVVTKVQHYHLARVPFYYIVDHESHDDPPVLIGYQWTRQKYVHLSPNKDGRFWLDSIGVWLGIDDGKVVCFDGVTGERLGDYTEISAALKEAQELAKAEAKRADEEKQRANDETKRADDETKRADDETKRADDEHRKRLHLEADLNALKEKLRILEGNG